MLIDLNSHIIYLKPQCNKRKYLALQHYLNRQKKPYLSNRRCWCLFYCKITPSAGGTDGLHSPVIHSHHVHLNVRLTSCCIWLCRSVTSESKTVKYSTIHLWLSFKPRIINDFGSIFHWLQEYTSTIEFSSHHWKGTLKC